MTSKPRIASFATILLITVISAGCSSLYYKTLESVGVPKREVMVYRVEKARDAQTEAREQFLTTLEQLSSLTHFEGGDLEATYKQLNSEYEESVERAETIRQRIKDIEDVSEALFAEWERELALYSSAALKRSSEEKMRQTRAHYQQLIEAMHAAEQKMEPVLTAFRDQVMYLKHNLNARAIASLQNELRLVETDIASLIRAMEQSIREADAFLKTLSG